MVIGEGKRARGRKRRVMRKCRLGCMAMGGMCGHDIGLSNQIGKDNQACLSGAGRPTSMSICPFESGNLEFRIWGWIKKITKVIRIKLMCQSPFHARCPRWRLGVSISGAGVKGVGMIGTLGMARSVRGVGIREAGMKDKVGADRKNISGKGVDVRDVGGSK